jgi:HAE1 family hydrophobic/amphiphilic exporter-1
MGQAVIGGVITSSLLTLVVVPVIYCWLDDAAVAIKRVLRRVSGAAGAAGTAGTSSRPGAELPQDKVAQGAAS